MNIIEEHQKELQRLYKELDKAKTINKKELIKSQIYLLQKQKPVK